MSTTRNIPTLVEELDSTKTILESLSNNYTNRMNLAIEQERIREEKKVSPEEYQAALERLQQMKGTNTLETDVEEVVAIAHSVPLRRRFILPQPVERTKTVESPNTAMARYTDIVNPMPLPIPPRVKASDIIPRDLLDKATRKETPPVLRQARRDLDEALKQLNDIGNEFETSQKMRK